MDLLEINNPDPKQTQGGMSRRERLYPDHIAGPQRKLSQVTRPSEAILFGDCTLKGPGKSNPWKWLGCEKTWLGIVQDGNGGVLSGPVHSLRGNCGFADGHVAGLPLNVMTNRCSAHGGASRNGNIWDLSR